MTYKMIQELYRETFNRTIKTCWIADVKRELGQTTRKSYNRLDGNSVKYPCPDGKIKIWLRNILAIN
ncbi:MULTISPECIES: hypothetical protein [Flavobacterium]|uniref:Uncharacterized protein n=1 Tax=Flavobacterium hankyongi TaxID=1176532 RepID=A0ABP9A8S4_9FLAO|nr:hypothetical protein [Flavobacterium sp. N1846]